MADINSGSEHKPATKDEAGFKFKPVGYGVQDIPSIISAAEDIGTHVLIVEQDQWYDEDAFECARKSREHLASLGL